MDARRCCASIKSKKHPDQQCPNTAKHDTEWCAVHAKSQKRFLTISTAGTIAHTIIPTTPKVTRLRRTAAAERIQRAWIRWGRRRLRQTQGPALFTPEVAHNDKDIYTYDSTSSIPLCYRFSYIDSKHHLWLFDIRFLVNLLQYGNDIKNPFTQESIDASIISQIQVRTEQLRAMKKSILYVSEEVLTPEQIWNQKVLDVFLKLTSLGYGVNVSWFETLTVRGHENFYRRLYELWHMQLQLTEEEKENVVPGHSSGRAPLFRWHPSAVTGRGFDIKWWRKQNLNLMRTFLTRSESKETQGCGALFILTAFANTHSRCAEAFPWLLQEED
jgi:hypothetical protein